MNDLILSVCMSVGSLAGGWGLTRLWWVGVMAAALGFVYPMYAAIACAGTLAGVAIWMFSRSKTTVRQVEDDDVIDAEWRRTA